MAVDPEIQLHIKNEIEKQRAQSDRSYAIKLVEKIVFYMIGTAAIAVLAAVIRLVIVS